METLQPLGLHIVVREDPEPDKTPGGILLCDYSERHFKTGTVMAAGEGEWKDDEDAYLSSELKVGDKTIAPIGAGYELVLDQTKDGEDPHTEEFRVMKSYDVWARKLRKSEAPQSEGCPLIPIRDRIIVRPDPDVETIGGDIVRPDGSVVKLFLPEQSKERKQNLGTVLAIGPGHPNKKTGKPEPIDLHVGDRVKWGRRAGIDIDVDGERFLVVSELNILVAV
jgi:chaperonin GroES